MYRFHIKSVLLGIGIGMIVTSITGMIYSAGMEGMSREEIIAKARAYGMVDADSIAKDQWMYDGIFSGDGDDEAGREESKPGDDAAIENNDAGSDKTPESENAVPNDGDIKGSAGNSQIVEEKIVLKINPGDFSQVVSQKLLDAGLIESIDSFSDLLKAEGLENKIQIGEYEFTKGTSMKEIIRTITKR